MKAIVTGSGSGLGEAIADALTWLEVSVYNLEPFDVRSVESCQALARRLPEDINILINCAGINKIAMLEDFGEEDWDLVFDTNLKSLFRLSQAFLPGMMDKGWGRIIGFTGMNAIKGHELRTHGSAVKHGVWGLVKSMAAEFGANGVTVNAISPGPILGDRDTQEKTDQIAGDLKYIPVGRLGAPDEVAAVASMLASERGGFVNGQMIQVNGGAVR